MTTAAPSFWSQFTAFLNAAVAAAKTEIEAIAAKVKPLVEAGAEEIAHAALQSVLTQAPLVLSGTEKLSAATANVITTLASTGKSVAAGVAEAAVQSAYSTVAASLAPKPAS